MSPFRPEAAAGAAAGAAAAVGATAVGATAAAAVVTVSLVGAQPPFSEGQGPLFYPCTEEGSALGFSRSLNGDGSGEGGGSAQNPPQKKKVSEQR